MTLTKTLPSSGRSCVAAMWALAKAMPKSSSIPMTSPVDFISGPRMMSTFGKRLKGKTDFLIEMWEGRTSSVKPRSRSFRPTMTLAASLASGTPMAFDTKGMVREARGLTSSM